MLTQFYLYLIVNYPFKIKKREGELTLRIEASKINSKDKYFI